MRLHDQLSAYLNELETAVNGLSAYAEKYVEEVLTPERVNLRLRLRFEAGYLLEVNEAVVVEQGALLTLGYRYHYQDDRNALIFRYDDTPHFPELDTFPHHKHTRDAVISHGKPLLLDVLREAASYASPAAE